MHPVTRLAANPKVPYELVHADERMLVVSKPAGVVTEPGIGHTSDSLINGLCAKWGEQMNALGVAHDYGLVHRLDKDTSGLLLIALDVQAYNALRSQFEQRTIRKTYLALVEGRPSTERGTLSVSLAEVRRGDMKIAAVMRGGQGEEATTRYRSLARGNGRTLMQLEPLTGRLHQIRVHMAHLGCPIVNDRVYRVDLPPNTSPPPRGRPVAPLALHAWCLTFRHPSGAEQSAMAPLPESFRELLKESQIRAPDAPVA